MRTFHPCFTPDSLRILDLARKHGDTQGGCVVLSMLTSQQEETCAIVSSNLSSIVDAVCSASAADFALHPCFYDPYWQIRIPLLFDYSSWSARLQTVFIFTTVPKII